MSVSRRGVRISANIRQLFKTGSVRAGVLAGATYPADILTNAKTGEQIADPRAGMPVASIAMALEYGHGQAIPRPFMQTAVTKHGKQWTALLVASVKAGDSTSDALLLTGHIMAEDITNTILDWPDDNSEQWAEFKGFNHGLMLTGHLSRSINSAMDGVE